MADINLKGMGVALITPFKEDESVDYEALGKLVDYQVQNGTDYLVVLGTTAETPTLTEEEKKNIISLVVTRVRGRIPIVLGVGGNCTRSVVEKLKTDNFEGIDAIPVSYTHLFRYPVQYVLRPNLDFRGFSGKVASGIVRKGDTVMALPSGKTSKVKSIEMCIRDRYTGDYTAYLIKRTEYLQATGR